MLFTGTGSLVYETERDDVYEDCGGTKNLFDFSGYPKDPKNSIKKWLVKWKMKLGKK